MGLYYDVIDRDAVCCEFVTGWYTGLENEQFVLEQCTETGRHWARPAQRPFRLTHPESPQLRRRIWTAARMWLLFLITLIH